MNLDAALGLLAEDANPPLDVAELTLCLARDEYPHLDVEGYLSELDAMAREAKAYLGGGLAARVAGLCRYLFHELGFRGNAQDYYDPRNSYLNQVLDRRTGLPITLSIVAIAIGRRAGLEVSGVGLPGHFIAKVSAGSEDALFDPFHGGRALTSTDCEALVQQTTGRPFKVGSGSLRSDSLRAIVTRLLGNLKAVYLERKAFVRAVRVLERLQQINPWDLQQRMDLGISLLHAGQPGRAIPHLEAYLAVDAKEQAELAPVRELLERAYAAVARWN
jgi:regulator of sirC expression with transglutaminase-like and TPR domain